MSGRWRRIVRASLTIGVTRERSPGQPGVEVRGERSIVKLVKQPEFLLQQQRAERRLVGVRSASPTGLTDGLRRPGQAARGDAAEHLLDHRSRRPRT
jgi:hypothetical protein